MTPKPKVPLLTDQDARLLREYMNARGSNMALDGLNLRAPLDALATGQAVTVDVMTENELLADWESAFGNYTSGWPQNDRLIHRMGYLALARAKGIVR